MEFPRYPKTIRKYMDWCLDPSPPGSKISRRLLAKSCGVQVAYLDRLDRDPEFLAELQKRALRLQVFTPEKVVRFMDVVMSQALEGDRQSQGIVARWLGRIPVWRGQSLEDVARGSQLHQDVRGMSDDELERFISDLQNG